MKNKTIEYLWAENVDSVHEFTMLILQAFEEKNRHNDYKYLEHIFNKYFVSNHKFYDFFEQIDIELIDSLEPLQKLEFHRLINELLVEYTYQVHANQTLLDILELAVISKATNINSIIYTIWRIVEQNTILSNSINNKEFRTEVLRLILSLPPIPVCNRIIKRMLSNIDHMEPEYMPFILLRRSIEDMSTLPNLLSIFTENDWEKYYSQKQTKAIIAEMIFDIGIYDIASIVHQLRLDSFWFIDALNLVKGIRFENKNEEWAIIDNKENVYPITYNYQLYQKLVKIKQLEEEQEQIENNKFDFIVPFLKNVNELLEHNNLTNINNSFGHPLRPEFARAG